MSNEQRLLDEALAAVEADDLDRAVAAADDLAARVPDDPGVLTLAGQINLAAGNTARAVELTGRAVAIDNRDAEVLISRAHALAAAGEHAEAVAAADRAEAFGGDAGQLVEARTRIANAAMDAEDWSAAVATLARLTHDPGAPADLDLMHAKALHRLGDPLYKVMLDRAAHKAPERLELLDGFDATDLFDALRDILPGSSGDGWTPAVVDKATAMLMSIPRGAVGDSGRWTELASRLARYWRADAVSAFLAQARDFAPWGPYDHFHAASAALHCGDMAEGLEDLDRALALAPDNPLILRANVLARRAYADDPAAVVDLCRRWTEAAPDDPEAWGARGDQLWSMDDHAQAAEAYGAARAAWTGPEDERPYVPRADVGLGRALDEARAAVWPHAGFGGPVCFYHVAHTGGRSLTTNLPALFPTWSSTITHRPKRAEGLARTVYLTRNVVRCWLDRGRRPDYAYIHIPYRGDPDWFPSGRYITVLRDPRAHARSVHHRNAAEGEGLAAFYETHPRLRNFQTSYILPLHEDGSLSLSRRLDELESRGTPFRTIGDETPAWFGDALDPFFLVGLTERMDETLFVAHVLAGKGVIPRNPHIGATGWSPDAADEAAIEKHFALDLELYDRAAKHFATRWAPLLEVFGRL